MAAARKLWKDAAMPPNYWAETHGVLNMKSILRILTDIVLLPVTGCIFPGNRDYTAEMTDQPATSNRRKKEGPRGQAIPKALKNRSGGRWFWTAEADPATASPGRPICPVINASAIRQRALSVPCTCWLMPMPQKMIEARDCA